MKILREFAIKFYVQVLKICILYHLKENEEPYIHVFFFFSFCNYKYVLLAFEDMAGKDAIFKNTLKILPIEILQHTKRVYVQNILNFFMMKK